MGEIRYYILRRVNEIRAACGRHALFIHEENSNAAQKHAQYVLEEMLKWGDHRFWEIMHFNPYCYGEYTTEHMGRSEGFGGISLEEQIEGIFSGFKEEAERGKKPNHWDNMLGNWQHMGADIAYDSATKMLVLAQRFS